MNHRSYVVLVSQPAGFTRHDYLVTSCEETARNAVRSIRAGEAKLPEEYRRDVQLVLRRTVDEQLHVD